MQYSRVILSRLAGMMIVMLIVVTIVFVIARIMPGNPAAVMLGPDATADDILALERRLGLDEPLFVQYWNYILSLLQGDFGRSIFLNQPVTEAILQRAEPTLMLTLFSLLIALAIAIPVGVGAAYWRGSAFDQLATMLAMTGVSIPSFWLGLLLMQLFGANLGWLPTSGYGGPGASFGTRISHLVLPAVALGVISASLITRFTRASMLDVLNEDYVRTARSKGMTERRVVLRHAFKNALIPILTVVGLTLALLVSGAVVIETVFNIPGVGSLIVDAVMRRDYPVLQGAVLITASMYVLINFMIDILYVLIDPRVRT